MSDYEYENLESKKCFAFAPALHDTPPKPKLITKKPTTAHVDNYKTDAETAEQLQLAELAQLEEQEAMLQKLLELEKMEQQLLQEERIAVRNMEEEQAMAEAMKLSRQACLEKELADEGGSSGQSASSWEEMPKPEAKSLALAVKATESGLRTERRVPEAEIPTELEGPKAKVTTESGVDPAEIPTELQGPKAKVSTESGVDPTEIPTELQSPKAKVITEPAVDPAEIPAEPAAATHESEATEAVASKLGTNLPGVVTEATCDAAPVEIAAPAHAKTLSMAPEAEACLEPKPSACPSSESLGDVELIPAKTLPERKEVPDAEMIAQEILNKPVFRAKTLSTLHDLTDSEALPPVLSISLQPRS